MLGGEADAITHRMAARFRQGWPLGEAIRGCVASLSGPTRTLRVGDLEVAVLEHGPWRRTFRRIGDEEVAEMLADGEPPELAAGGSGDGASGGDGGSGGEDGATASGSPGADAGAAPDSPAP